VRTDPTQIYSPWAKSAALAAHLIVAGVSLALFVFAQPLADDFCTAANRLDVSDYVRYMYFQWSGRWASLAIEKVVLSNLDPTRVYPFLLSALALCHFASLYLFVRGFFRDHLPPRLILALTGAFFVLYWSLHPALGQAYYWFTGAVEYQLALSLSLTLLALLMHVPGEGNSRPLQFLRAVLRAAGAAALGFFVPGMHELFGLMLCVLLGAGAVMSRRLGYRNSKLWALAAAAAAAGFLFVLATPGYTIRREGFFPDSYNVPLTLWLTGWQAVKAGTSWVCDAKLLAATAVFVMHPAIRALRPEWLSRAPEVWKRLTLGGWAVLLAIGFGAPAFVTGQEMPRRVLGGIYLVFLLGWFLVVFVFTRPGVSEPVPPSAPRPILSWTLLFFALCVVTTGNTRTAIHDLVHWAVPWRRAIEQRYDSIRAAAGTGAQEVVVPAAPPRPATFFQGPADITPDAADWKNQCQADFFGVSLLRYDDAKQ
jgi:hypothetical protein